MYCLCVCVCCVWQRTAYVRNHFIERLALKLNKNNIKVGNEIYDIYFT